MKWKGTVVDAVTMATNGISDDQKRKAIAKQAERRVVRPVGEGIIAA
ncbi:MAG: hypothetical protein JW913_09445 [Chitinispirillaceae bacterium]|nr:hypothetical protein [Chitinispirillaceae bacterium]